MQAKPEGWPASRAKQAGGEMDMPCVPECAGYLLEVATDLGMAAASGMGAGPLPYAEIASAAPWADAVERRIIREMSVAYLSGREIGADPLGIPPWEA